MKQLQEDPYRPVLQKNKNVNFWITKIEEKCLLSIFPRLFGAPGASWPAPANMPPPNPAAAAAAPDLNNAAFLGVERIGLSSSCWNQTDQ